MQNKIFITGTDTEVGKTFYARHLITEWMRHIERKRLCYIKPFQTGVATPDQSDEAIILRSGLSKEHVYTLSRYRLPASPQLAAAHENKYLSYHRILTETKAILAKYSHGIIEGAGGLCVPLDGEHMMIDFIRDMNLPVILVGRLGLGTLNHTIMSLHMLESKNIPLHKIVLNARFASSHQVVNINNLQVLRHAAKVPVDLLEDMPTVI